MAQYKGASRNTEINTQRRRRDTRRFGKKFTDLFDSADGVVLGLFILPFLALLTIKVPLSGEFVILIVWLYGKRFVNIADKGFDFPYRAPLHAHVGDGSYPRQKNSKTGKREWKPGTGIAYLGQDLETKEQVYSGDSDLRTHMLVLGTTGSGKPQPKHAKVLTPEGWRTMGSVEVGDLVCTPDGKTAPILKIYEQGIREVWNLHLRKGKPGQGTGDHLWRVLVCRDGKEEAQTLTTDAIRALLDEKARVLLPIVKRKGKGAKFRGWMPIWKITPAGEYDCRCIEIDHPHHLYITDNQIVTHNTEFLLGLVFNALIQNTGFIYVDGKGDPKLQKEIFRLARFLGREDDLLIINFITSGRDFIETQVDKVTNNMNIMGNTSSGMLIELIVSLMDDSGGGGDMWKGRAISFVASLTRPLTYLRDKGYINLSPEKYLEYFELNVIEELVWEHNGRYGELFDVIVAPLRSYLITLPGYQKTKLKKQEQKTLEQHGFIVMQLTRIFNDLNFNYGHIFKTKVGDVDFFDVVINRRMLVVLLPALERAPDSLRMLGKMIVGSIKQMMAGCLGNRVEGVVREIIDSRPTNAIVPFYCILDEYGYYAVVGFAVAPAQARSLGFSVTFAAQDFSSLKKSSAEEADATWENTNVRAVGRITSGEESETWRRIQGAAGTTTEAMLSGFERKMGAIDEVFRTQDNVSIEKRNRLDYDDLAMQENGEFTFLIGKKEQGGQTGGVRVIRGMGFYTAGQAPKEMRINDFLPVEAPEPSDLPQNKKAAEALMNCFIDGSFKKLARGCIKADPTLHAMGQMFARNHANPERPTLPRGDIGNAVLGWFLADSTLPQQKATSAGGSQGPAAESAVGNSIDGTPAPSPQTEKQSQQAAAERALMNVCKIVQSVPKEAVSPYTTAMPIRDESGDEIRVDARTVTNLVTISNEDVTAFNDRALPLLRSFFESVDDVDDGVPEEDWFDEVSVANRDLLLDVEMSAQTKPFTSIDEIFDQEERIERMQDFIIESTQYPSPPTPEPMHVGEASLKLKGLAKQCEDEVRDKVGGMM